MILGELDNTIEAAASIYIFLYLIFLVIVHRVVSRQIGVSAHWSHPNLRTQKPKGILGRFVLAQALFKRGGIASQAAVNSIYSGFDSSVMSTLSQEQNQKLKRRQKMSFLSVSALVLMLFVHGLLILAIFVFGDL